jgi:hypothetical protein
VAGKARPEALEKSLETKQTEAIGGIIMAVKHTIKAKSGGTETVSLTARTAIRKKCLDCSGWTWAEVRECPACTCPLWPYRGTGRPVGKVEGVDAGKG